MFKMEIRDIIYKYAIKNAYEHGKALEKAVIGKIVAENPGIKSRIKELLPIIKEVVEYVNKLPREKIEEEYHRFEYVKREIREKKELPSFNLEKIVVRFAPNPSGPLHIGHARAAILNDEYAKKFRGKFILRFEDTDPYRIYYKDENENGYKMILEDLEYLDVDVHEMVYQSDRLEIYYDFARKLIEMGLAYVCKCNPDYFRELRNKGIACKHRYQDVEKNLREFEKMFTEYKEGEAVLRLKTDLNHPDPSIRDFPIMRICEKKHPRTNYKVFPLMNFSVAIDDHLLGITLVLRGKDHIVNTEKQRFIYRYFNWKEPVFVHYGLLKIEEGILSTREILEKINKGEIHGWDDPRLLTIRALKRRCIKSESIRKLILELGLKETDVKISMKTLYNYNREVIDKEANRYFFVKNPVKLILKNSPRKVYKIRLHPKINKGFRKLFLGDVVYISIDDASTLNEGQEIRLMEAANIRIVKKRDNEILAEFLNEDLKYARENNLKLIHWVPEENIPVKILKACDNNLIYDEGFAERNLLFEKENVPIQFERYGFVKIERKSDEYVECLFMHD